MKNFFHKLFRKRKSLTVRSTSGRLLPTGRKNLKPLTIEGVGEAPLTAEPDDAELAAQALLEMMAEASDKSRNNDKAARRNNDITLSRDNEEKKTAAYFRALAARIKAAHNASELRAMRFVAFCEQELRKPDLPLEGPGSLWLLNVELMKRLDTIERVGGELKKRWQHCVAQVLVRIYNHNDNDNETTN